MHLSQYFESIRGKRVAVLGMGVSNAPLVKLLLQNGIETTVRDKKTLPPIEGAVCISGEGYLDALTEDILFRTPGMRPDSIPAREDAVITSEMELFFSLCPCPIYAVTGSDGKTTTTTIIAKLLEGEGKKVWLGGNIGTPLLSHTDEINANDCVVVELSSFQLMSMRQSPHIAVITNVQPNHLDWHRDMQEYIEAKKNLCAYQTAGDLLVLNADDAVSQSFASPAALRRFSLKGEADCFFDGETIFMNGEAVITRREIRLPGLHNIANYMAALCAVYPTVRLETFRRVARNFGGVEHRLETVRETNGITFINDSIASSPSRTVAGLRALEGKSIVLIAGGYDKHIPYAPLVPELRQRVKTLVLTGATGPKILDALNETEGDTPKVICRSDFRDAVLAAAGAAEAGDVVLLSPASASFDCFPNFEVRGNRFKEIVSEL